MSFSPVFFDPQRRRWKRLRRVTDTVGVLLTLLVVYFAITIIHGAPLPALLLPEQHHPYRALKEKEHKERRKPHPVGYRKRMPATQVAPSSAEGLRSAFYVAWDAASYSSLREYLHQIDLLFPEWLHLVTPDGRIQGVREGNSFFDVIDGGKVRQVDNKVMPLIRQEKAETEVLPLINNFDARTGTWAQQITQVLNDPARRQYFRQQVLQFLASDQYRGLMLDFEGFPESGQPGFRALVAELAADLHARGMKLYVSLPANDDDFDYKYIGEQSDGVILMDYDQHEAGGEPGPIASQDWFVKNLQDALKLIPPNKLMCALANYSYEWVLKPQPHGRADKLVSSKTLSVQDAWLEAHDAEADLELDSDSFNPHFAFADEKNLKHEVWLTDGVTVLNQMRAAQQLGINGFALWRLGSEDRSMWSVWDDAREADAPGKLRQVPPGEAVDTEGEGDIVRIGSRPTQGIRSLKTDSSGMVTEESFDPLPTPYELDQYGGVPKKIALTFDDGPDPQWTPKILDVLKAEHAPATFFAIGQQCEKYGSLVRRIYREGHEFGNHTWTHPDISSISGQYFQVELNLTERYFASVLGVKPLLFRPPYSIDQEPDTSDQVRPLQIAQDLGYITVGDKIDPNDWHNDPRPTAAQITQSVLDQLDRGNIILLHDGGGNRGETVRALPMIIDQLRARGYQLVLVSDLLGKTRDEIMPPIARNERWSASLDRLGFWLYGIMYGAIVLVFFLGDILMSARLLLVGAAAIYDRLRRRHDNEQEHSEYKPRVAVLIPAYNEETVIERTVRSVLQSDYPHLRIIVIDDGSKDRTLEVVRASFGQDPRVLILTKPNGGKAEALNYGLRFVEEEIYVGIDADTVIHPTALSYLVPHFVDPRVAAVAGNAKVGNRVNLWTRWQALEYITSQNFERRALNVLGAVTVVPGAIGAWRTQAVRAAEQYQPDTVAEDADLTMSLLHSGYRVEYEDRALAFTEAPNNANGLMRQRFRWSFGILQAVWKNRAAVKRKGALGWVALPNIVIFQIVLPLVSPFIDLMFIIGVAQYALDRHFHPATANPASLQKLVAFFLAFLVIDFVASALAFTLERRSADRREDVWLLGQVWLQRFAYRQLFSLVLIKTLKHALKGGHFSWDKLERKANVKFEAEHAEASR